MIKALIFDCFGVIITDALQVICNELRARDPAAADRIGDIIKANNRGLLSPPESNRQIAGLLGITVEEFRAQKNKGEAKDAALMEYIASLRPRYKTALLSNVGSGSMGRRFAAEELSRCFDLVVESGEIGYAKPDPEAYKVTAARLSVSPQECIFTDDRESYCTAARATGMQSIHYQSFDQFKAELERILRHGQNA